MKKTFMILASSLCLTIAFSSCDLERQPRHQKDAFTSLQSLKDAQAWDNGFMSALRARQGGLFTVIQDRQADQLNATADFGNRMGAPHGWVSFNADDDDMKNVWLRYYSALKNINLYLGSVGKLNLSDPNEKQELDIITGHAHFLRAYYYFNLAIRFGMPYKAATASTDLCVPLVLTYDPTALPGRATNEEVYNQILNVDLKTAKEKLASVKGTPKSDAITIDAVTALEARIKLFMSDWNGALEAAKSLIESNTYPLVAPESENFQKMWHSDDSSEEILQLFIQKPDELPNTVTSYYAASQALKANTPDWLPSQWFLDLYDDKDLRKPAYFEQRKINMSGFEYEGLYIISKVKGNKDYAEVQESPIWGYVPDGRNSPKVFRIAEMYLIAAEAAYSLNNESDAKKYLNALRASRGLEAVTADGNKLFEEIKDERTRELAFEGFRLWDLRRWGMDMVRRAPQMINGTSPFLATQFSFDYKISNTDHRWIWGIPANDLKTNPTLKGQQNPGW